MAICIEVLAREILGWSENCLTGHSHVAPCWCNSVWAISELDRLTIVVTDKLFSLCNRSQSDETVMETSIFESQVEACASLLGLILIIVVRVCGGGRSNSLLLSHVWQLENVEEVELFSIPLNGRYWSTWIDLLQIRVGPDVIVWTVRRINCEYWLRIV